MTNVVIFGATSAIAIECARIYAQRGAHLTLAARNVNALEPIVQDLRVRGASGVEVLGFDAEVLSEHEALVEHVINGNQKVDIALIAHGSLAEMDQCSQSLVESERALRINLLSPIALLTPLANYFESQGKGSIAVISSVAGDRGRKSNYVYGSAKAALSTFVDGLRNRLYSKNVHVLTIKPGFVDTPMTEHMKKGALFATPKKVASDIVKAIDKKKDVLYTPWFWQPIMMIIKAIPETIFKRMSI